MKTFCKPFFSRAALLLLLTGCVSAQTPTATITDCDAPFLFAYGSWEGKVKTVGGEAILAGVTPRGGAGANCQLDLSAQANATPAVRLKVGAGSTLKTLRLLLRDAGGQTAAFDFSLPTTGNAFVLLRPNDAATLRRPNALDKPGGGFDLSHVVQWQFSGDYRDDGPVSLTIDAVSVAAPDPAAVAARAAREVEEAAALQRQHDADRAKYPRGPKSPVIERVSLAAPGILCVTVRAGRVVPGSVSKYAAQAGDGKKTEKAGAYEKQTLTRGGQDIGWLIGPKHDFLTTFESLDGDPLLDFLADDAGQYSVNGVKPVAVWRKSKPTDWAQPGRGFAVRHEIYLKMSRGFFAPGKSYELTMGAVNVQKPSVTFIADAAKNRSESVHVNQIGFRPDDPVKRAFLSLWLGTGGAYTFPANLPFSLVDDKTNTTVFRGKARQVLAADAQETLARTDNFSKTEVSVLDFSAFRTPGRFRVVVENVGSSYPFTLGPNVWKAAFLTQMRGLFHERSGVALRKPVSDFDKPRDFHPADGAQVFQSTYSILDGGNEGQGLEKGSTGKRVAGAWGGYHDAGDWNPRRVTHLRVTMASLELCELFPKFFLTLPLQIAPKTPGVPDILTEARFELDVWKRLQGQDGGIPFGIETNGDPLDGEVSWHQSMPAYVYAPDAWSSFIYAGVAARLSKVLAPFDAQSAKAYLDSAKRAFAWGERDWAARKNGNIAHKWEARDDRNLAALVLYDATGDSKTYLPAFLDETCLDDADPKVFVWGEHVQRDAAFLYARTKRPTDPKLQSVAVKLIEQQAQAALHYASGNAFNLTTPDSGKPQFLAFYSTPDAIELARAHFLTGKPEYLAGVVQATQFQLGGNPANVTYTTGLGANPPRHPLHLDTRRTGQAVAAGFTVYGNIDFVRWNDEGTIWPIKYYLNAACTPPASDWPLHEAFWDIFLFPMMLEWTVDVWDKNVYVWGYLAARK